MGAASKRMERTTNMKEQRTNMISSRSVVRSVVIFLGAGAIASLAGCASQVDEPAARSQQELTEAPVEAVCLDVEPFTDLEDDGAAGADSPTPPGASDGADADPGAGGAADEGDGSGGLEPQTLRPLAAKTACETSCDAAFPSKPGVYGSCSNIFLTACYVACRGADSAKAACAALRGGRAPRGWVKALQRICAISGL